jgi:hypothetical protein
MTKLDASPSCENRMAALDSLARRASRDCRRAVGRNRKSEIRDQKSDDGAGFAIPESICQLRFDELPITTRLVNVLRSIGARTLGDLQGCTPFELLQYKNCGLRTLREIKQLIERALSGEFDVAQIEEHTAAPELLTLLEQGMAKLSPRQRQFLLARIGGEGLPCLTFKETGRRHGLTRARAHQVVVKALDTLRKTYGPRIPRLLEILNRHCLSDPPKAFGAGLTPALLEQWIGESSSPAVAGRLSREAQVHLIAALDKNIPWYVESSPKAFGPDKPDLNPANLARALRLAVASEIPRSYGGSG